MLTYNDLEEAKRMIEQKESRPLTIEEFERIRQKNIENYEKLKGCAYIAVKEKNGWVSGKSTT